ncbi:MAG: proton-conducting transporter membrane subunit [Acidilobaceae archaeon]
MRFWNVTELEATLTELLSLMSVSAFDRVFESFAFISYEREALLFVATIALVLATVALSATDFEVELKARSSALIVSTGLLLALAVSSDHLILWLIFYELSSFPLILYLFFSSENSVESRKAATLLAVFTVASGMLVALGVLIAYLDTGSFWINEVTREGSLVAGILVALGLLLKLPIVPLHFWLVLVYSALPSHLGAVAVCLEGATMFFLLKIVGKTLMIPTLSESNEVFVTTLLFLSLGLVSAVYSALQGLSSKSSRELLAFSSIIYSNSVLLILASSFFKNSEGVSSLFETAVYYTIAYILSKSAWFTLLGVLEKTSGSSNLEMLRGSVKSDPLVYFLGLTLLFMILPSPPSLKFFSELFVVLLSPSGSLLSGAITIFLAMCFVLATSLTTSFIYIVWTGETKRKGEITLRPLVSIALLSLALIVGGLSLLYNFYEI